MILIVLGLLLSYITFQRWMSAFGPGGTYNVIRYLSYEAVDHGFREWVSKQSRSPGTVEAYKLQPRYGIPSLGPDTPTLLKVWAKH